MDRERMHEFSEEIDRRFRLLEVHVETSESWKHRIQSLETRADSLRRDMQRLQRQVENGGTTRFRAEP